MAVKTRKHNCGSECSVGSCVRLHREGGGESCWIVRCSVVIHRPDGRTDTHSRPFEPVSRRRDRGSRARERERVYHKTREGGSEGRFVRWLVRSAVLQIPFTSRTFQRSEGPAHCPGSRCTPTLPTPYCSGYNTKVVSATTETRW